MNREQIIQMAREAGLDPDLWNYTDAFERFAAFVAAAEREACAKVCEEMRTYIGRNNAVTQSSAQDCANAIRARGNVAQRTWVGLTPQERDEINEQVYGAVPHHVAFHAAIEAKLKAKNT